MSTTEESAESFSPQKCKARTVVGRGVKSLLCDPGSELRLGRRGKKKGEGEKWNEKASLFGSTIRSSHEVNAVVFIRGISLVACLPLMQATRGAGQEPLLP